jgi:hypothetical protein
MDLLKWFQEWYRAQCNLAWEHGPVIAIQNLDDPGWIFSIDLKGTSAEGATMPYYSRDQGDDDWIICHLEDGEFRCNGDPTKLVEMLELFRQVVTPFAGSE